MGKIVGNFAAVVVSNEDPLQIGRIKIRVPILHGFEGNPSGLVEDKNLPWALPDSLPCGGSPESGGISWIPVVGDQVWISFLDGEMDNPVWRWGNQNTEQVKKWPLPLHKYEGKTPVRRAALSRFEHWHEILPEGHDIWTKQAWHFTITDGVHFRWDAPTGSYLELTGSDYTLNTTGKETHVIAGDVKHEVAGQYSADILKNVEWTTPEYTINAPITVINGDLTVLGDGTGGNVGTATIKCNLVLRGNFTMTGNLTLDGDVNITGDVAIKGDVNVDGILRCRDINP